MKINDRIVGGVTAAALMGVVALGVVGVATAAPEPAAVVETTSLDLDAYPDTNGLAAEQEADAAAVEAARVEAERVAAEQAAAAAAAEAARVAAEQAAASAPEAQADEPSDEGGNDTPAAPAPAPAPNPGYDPASQPHAICEVLEDGTQVPCQF